jgi:hypothetical protein
VVRRRRSPSAPGTAGPTSSGVVVDAASTRLAPAGKRESPCSGPGRAPGAGVSSNAPSTTPQRCLFHVKQAALGAGRLAASDRPEGGTSSGRRRRRRQPTSSRGADAARGGGDAALGGRPVASDGGRRGITAVARAVGWVRGTALRGVANLQGGAPWGWPGPTRFGGRKGAEWSADPAAVPEPGCAGEADRGGGVVATEARRAALHRGVLPAYRSGTPRSGSCGVSDVPGKQTAGAGASWGRSGDQRSRLSLRPRTDHWRCRCPCVWQAGAAVSPNPRRRRSAYVGAAAVRACFT